MSYHRNPPASIKRFPLLLLLCFLSALAVAAAPAHAPWIRLDELGLKATNAAFATELALTGQGSPKIKADVGNKLVVVTLAGVLKTPGRYVVSPALFSVWYERDSESQPGEIIREVSGARHVEVYADHWGASAAVERTQPGPVTIRFAALVPDGVTRMWVGVAESGPEALNLSP